MSLSNQISSIFGKIASHAFSPSLQRIINKTYAKIFDIDMSEFAPCESYQTLQALFTRKLLIPRNIDESSSSLISPCDALIMEAGQIKNGTALQIKGKTYKIDDLVNYSELASSIEHGVFINFYLSPRDYHRYHAPLDMTILWAAHIPGALYPVNRPALQNVDELFNKNERVALCCEDANGKIFFLVFVGALNVGSIVLNFDERIKTNSKKTEISVYKYEELWIKKGDEMGRFEMGSTIVALFGENYLQNLPAVGQKVKFGEKISAINCG